ncbi:DUF3606 domain-containing protein [Sphingobacterium sp. NGMCC 1.201703]|uniref:DUF3606 domain-containing protein n=1 Tax=Sphingobacterium sp. NGMCC 1.201703 TaxID=3388657 RepID=UPI0039FCF8C0
MLICQNNQTVCVGACSIQKRFVCQTIKIKRPQETAIRSAVVESYEVDYIAKELGVSRQKVEAAIEKVGNSREEISKYLRNNKK